MADNRPPIYSVIDWFSRRNQANNDYYKNAPQVGMNATPGALRYAMPPMRDSEIPSRIDEMTGGAPSYPPMSGSDAMRMVLGQQLNNNGMAPARQQEIAFANGQAAPVGGSMADARAQEIAYANQAQNAPGSMGAARQQEIAFANSQRNPAAGRGGAGGAGGGQMYGPTMADMPNGGKPTYYYMDPGDGGIVRTILSQNGMPPSMSGYTMAGSQEAPADQGLLTKILRGAF